MLSRAVIYGSVMGSFCCERFGVERFRTLTRAEIDARFEEFRKFTSFLRSLALGLRDVRAARGHRRRRRALVLRARLRRFITAMPRRISTSRAAFSIRARRARSRSARSGCRCRISADPFRDARRLVAHAAWRAPFRRPPVSCSPATISVRRGAARLSSRTPPGSPSMLCFALNPNMLYLQSTPMTEPLFAASLAALLWATLWFRDSQSIWALLARRGRVERRVAHALRRLVPDSVRRALFLAGRETQMAARCCSARSRALGPLAWLAHNQFLLRTRWSFITASGRRMAIYQRQLAQGMQRIPAITTGAWRSNIISRRRDWSSDGRH